MALRPFFGVECDWCGKDEFIPLVELQTEQGEHRQYRIPQQFRARCYRCGKTEEYWAENVKLQALDQKPNGFRDHPGFQRIA